MSTEQEKARRRQLHRGIAPGDGAAALPAASPEMDEAEHWDVVPGSDRATAPGTGRSWQYRRLADRDAVYQDVQVAADDQADHHCHQIEEDCFRHVCEFYAWFAGGDR